MSRKHLVQNLTAKLMQFRPSCVRKTYFQVTAKFSDCLHERNFEDFEKSVDYFLSLCPVPNCQVSLYRTDNLTRELFAVNGVK